MSQQGELLGQVILPSGILVVLDCGLLNLWSHDQPPVFPPGILPPDTVESINAGVDFRIDGDDATHAGKYLARQWHPHYVYDIPHHGLEETKNAFAEVLQREGLSAELVACEARIPHRTRVDQALDYGKGAGELFFHGLTGGVASGLPRQRELPLVGVRMNEGEFPDCWRHVELRLKDEYRETRTRTMGQIAVDTARILFGDADALGAWQHDEPTDGLADYVFWGLNAAEVAQAVGAPPLGEGRFGWVDQEAKDVVVRGTAIERLRSERGLKLAGDFRPHSHHYALLKKMRASPLGAGTLLLGEASLCGLFTSWGDGFFPFLQVLEEDELVAIRVVLGTDRAQRALRAVNRRAAP